jgi:hypothetical protein
MKQRLMSAVYRSAAKRSILSTAILTIGAVVAIAEPAAAKLTANHNETLVRDAG